MKKEKKHIFIDNPFDDSDGLSLVDSIQSFNKWESELPLKTHTAKQYKENHKKFSRDYMGQRLAGFCSQYSKILFYLNNGKECKVHRMRMMLEGHRITHTYLRDNNGIVIDPTASQFDKVDVDLDYSSGSEIKTGMIDGFFEFRHNVFKGTETYLSQEFHCRIPPKWFLKLIPTIIEFDERFEFLNKWLIAKENFDKQVMIHLQN